MQFRMLLKIIYLHHHKNIAIYLCGLYIENKEIPEDLVQHGLQVDALHCQAAEKLPVVVNFIVFSKQN